MATIEHLDSKVSAHTHAVNLGNLWTTWCKLYGMDREGFLGDVQPS